MVVNTHKFGHTKSYEPQSIIGKGGVNKNVTRQLFLRSKPNVDFITADKFRTSFRAVEIKKNLGQLGVRQISSYLRMPVVARGLYILPLERDIERGGIFVYEGIETLPKLIKVARPIEIGYLNQELVESLLGSEGKYVLEQVLSVVKDLALEMDWPLDGVEIRHVRDAEVKDWEYVLLLLIFTCDFDTADRHLHELYNQIDTLTSKLSDKGQEVLQRMVFFDIETKASISSD